MPSSTVTIRRFGALATLFTAAACASPAAERAAMAQSALVGLPEPALLSCAGVPNRTAVEGNLEYLTYSRGGIGRAASPSASIGIGGGSSSGVGIGVGFGLPIGRSYPVDECEATFILRNGVVQQLLYRTGRGSIASCEPIVQNCVALTAG